MGDRALHDGEFALPDSERKEFCGLFDKCPDLGHILTSF
jgi:hypothetical protein